MTEKIYTPSVGARNHQFASVVDICELSAVYRESREERRAVANRGSAGWL